MKTARLLLVPLFAFSLYACGGADSTPGKPIGGGGGNSGSAARDAAPNYGSGGARPALSTGTQSSGGGSGGGSNSLSPSLASDAPTFNGNSPISDAGSAAADRPVATSIDAGARQDSMGGGGQIGSGGRVGAGGTTTGTAGTSGFPDAWSPPSIDGGSPFPDAGPSADAFSPDLRASDLAPSDVVASDAFVPCVAQIDSVVPTADWLSNLFSGTNTQIVLRATVVSGGPGTSLTWSWQASWQGVPVVAAAVGQQDPAAAVFAIANPGDYTFVATDRTGACRTPELRATARSPSGCPLCDSYVGLRAAPPPSNGVPVQFGFLRLLGKPPFSDPPVILASGVPVKVVPNVAGGILAAYVRIFNPSGELVADGYANTSGGSPLGFNTWLRQDDASSGYPEPLRYDVLVVPLDGPDGGAVAATAPQLYRRLTTDTITTMSSAVTGGFSLQGGVSVSGRTTAADGTPIADVRVILTNQNPAQSIPANQQIFSSVGRSDSQGNFLLNAQPGSYWAWVSPPVESGFAESLAPTPVVVSGTSTLDFQFDAPRTAGLTLQVVDVTGAALAGCGVRVTSRQSEQVGTLGFRSGSGATAAQTATGGIEIHATTSDAGVVTFPRLPTNAIYDLLLVPAEAGPLAATTRLSVQLGEESSTQTVKLLAQSRITGRLVVASGGNQSSSLDFTQVEVVAYDKSEDTPESPRTVFANADGTFSISVTPSRPYVLLAVPPADSGWARTFIGPGALRASEFTVTQKVLASMDWISTVKVSNGTSLPGTALQAFCQRTWANCNDPEIPLAETTAGVGGAFRLELPNPETR